MIKLVKNNPFLLKPAAKNYIWGGTRLNDEFCKKINMDKVAETWECSTHKDGNSIVFGGYYNGMRLTDVLKKHPEFMGKNIYNKLGELPVLIKIIDAQSDLSIQVHPDDEYAKNKENGSLGKDEMWYILDCEQNSSIVYGFYNDVKKDELENSISNGTIEKYLQRVYVNKGDIFYIPAGCVHAIGRGNLIVEIQENSNITYRLYDYNRIDANGRKRKLNIQKALEVINLSETALPRQHLSVIQFRNGYATELLCKCRYFEVQRILLNTERCRKMASINSIIESFQVLLCIDGCGVMFGCDNFSLSFFKGDCIFIPADCGEFRIHGKGELLKVRC
ncbi:class I mannose-6-phosphate isomerase [Eubacterium sp. MSJ-13]|uniref:type I phosphomannose isomerase catalytic subunit n=1 Tax=Eubacterium sp. MSJ-13 TaxID=2841513 RepID=UPI001C0F5889|nr:type I phosphomannose isomerase catalytic subunit [Eubacterium sp. MSJ-13]MBU5477614.1 class I mannose-6-phosphate isomerase [Eubacterium sp. MSJ-13]